MGLWVLNGSKHSEAISKTLSACSCDDFPVVRVQETESDSSVSE